MSQNLSEMSSQNKQKKIEMMMRARRARFNRMAARQFGEKYESSDMRNDNDMDLLTRESLLSESNNNNNSNNNNRNNNSNNFGFGSDFNFGNDFNNNNNNNNDSEEKLNNNNFMDFFDENYYLNNTRTTKKAVSEDVAMMNANGLMNDNLSDNRKLDRSELLKKKALDLETLIVDRVTRDKLDDAKRVFSVLEKMHHKYDDDMVSDIFYRVLQSMPADPIPGEYKYSHKTNKNNFKDVLKELNTKDNIRAFNEDNNCISSLGDMFEECDLDICSDKCKKNIMLAKKESERDECQRVITGYKNDKEVKMKDDVKEVILERLKYCKKIADMKKGNFDLITYADKQDLKNQIIEEIQKMSRLANMHYNSCYESASKMFAEDPKYKSILNILKEIDFRELSLERLQEIRNDLQTLPTCSMLRYEEHNENRDENLTEGIRVGKYIIPKKTDYYEQIKGKDRPFVYRDIATDKHYLYDSFSKTLTPFEYPMTQESLEKQLELDGKYDRKELDNKYLGPAEFGDLYDIDFKIEKPEEVSVLAPSPAPVPVETVVEEIIPAPTVMDNNLNTQINNLVSDSEKKVIGNLTLKNVLEYLFVALIVILIIIAFAPN